MAHEPALMNSPAFSKFTPPVGRKRMCGRGPLSALIYFGPPNCPAGKIFTMSAPISQAWTTSVGVIAPGIAILVYLLHILMTSSFNEGATTNSAPARMDALAVSPSRTVPAPKSTSFPNFPATFSITPIALGTVIVISIVLIPPSLMASTMFIACSGDWALITGTIPHSSISLSCSDFLSINSPPFASLNPAGVLTISNPSPDLSLLIRRDGDPFASLNPAGVLTISNPSPDLSLLIRRDGDPFTSLQSVTCLLTDSQASLTRSSLFVGTATLLRHKLNL
ncbi:hypothetical protein ES705_42343 [subsurface metagenome]